VYSFIREEVTGWNLFLQGYQDAWGVTQTNYQQVMSRQGQLSPEMARRGIRLHSDTSPVISYFTFDRRDPVFGGYTPRKRKLRQAISLALDSQAFIDLFSQGRGIAAQFLIPPGIFGYDPHYRNPYRQFDPDLKWAHRLLDEAGYLDGIDPQTGERLMLYFDDAATTPEGRQFTALVVKQIEALGLDVKTQSWRPIIWQDRVTRGSSNSSSGAGWQTTRTRKTSSFSSMVPTAASSTPPSTITRSTTAGSSRCGPWTTGRNAWPSSAACGRSPWRTVPGSSYSMTRA
jgi:ABC-type transport system substrate-binding protein